MLQGQLITRSGHSLADREQLSRQLAAQNEWEAVPHVLLATCNRTEAYWGEGDIPRPLADHLFRVAAGLESALIGERAIQGQLKQAYEIARGSYRLSPALNRLFQTALHVGKRVRSETHIAQGAVSHSQVTADMLRQYGINLSHSVIAIIGVNKLTEDILKYLTARGALNIHLSNRNFDKAKELANRYGAVAMRLDQKRELLAVADVLICATSAPHLIIRQEDFVAPRLKPILLFDLAFPRDIDPAVAGMEGITLHDLDDIEQFGRRNISLRRAEIAKAEHIISQEIDKLFAWQQRAELR